MFVSPQKIRWLFLVKALIVPAAWLAMLIWAVVKVPASQGLFGQHSQLKGSNFSWSWLSALNSALGIYSTLAVNIPDFTVSHEQGSTSTHSDTYATTAVRKERTSVSPDAPNLDTPI